MVAVSTDELAVSRSVASQMHLSFPILADRPGGMGSSFGIFTSGGMHSNTDSHSMFVIDSQGVVRWGQVAPSMVVNMQDVQQALDKAS